MHSTDNLCLFFHTHLTGKDVWVEDQTFFAYISSSPCIDFLKRVLSISEPAEQQYWRVVKQAFAAVQVYTYQTTTRAKVLESLRTMSFIQITLFCSIQGKQLFLKFSQSTTITSIYGKKRNVWFFSFDHFAGILHPISCFSPVVIEHPSSWSHPPKVYCLRTFI